MPKYLIQASFTDTGVKGLLQDGGSKRRTAVNLLMKSLGGSVEAFYYGFGEGDVHLIVDLPDNTTAATVSLVATASGAFNIRTTPLLTPEEIDHAVKKTVQYRAPGR